MWYWSIISPRSLEQALERIAAVPGVAEVMFVSPWGLPILSKGKFSRRDNTAIAGFATALAAASKTAGVLPYGSARTISTSFDQLEIFCALVPNGMLVFCWEGDAYRPESRSKKWVEILSKVGTNVQN